MEAMAAPKLISFFPRRYWYMCICIDRAFILELSILHFPRFQNLGRLTLHPPLSTPGHLHQTNADPLGTRAYPHLKLHPSQP